MLHSRMSASCYEIGYAPRADEEIAYIDDVDDDFNQDAMSSAMSTSQNTSPECQTVWIQIRRRVERCLIWIQIVCNSYHKVLKRSSVVTADSGRASSQSTLKSPEKDGVKKRSSKKMTGCRVALLNGTTFEPKGINKNATGQDLFEKVVKYLDIIETDYFGLTYRDKTGKKFWIDHAKKISKQVNGGTWVFEFQVKFYTPDPMSMKEDITRYQLCLQLRVDIFNGKLPCSFATYALLGSYTVQGELGDWDEVECGPSIDYLHDFDFAPSQNNELLEKIAELHKHHKGLTPTVAEAHFLENAKKLAMFGVDLHDAKSEDKLVGYQDSDSKDIQLGVCANGILVFKDRLRINRFVWPKILKLSYKRNNFYVRVRPGEFEPHERTIMFGLENHKLAKRLWKTCVEHHAFFRLKETDPHQTDTLFPRFNTKFRYSGRTAHQARKAAEQVHRDEPHIARTAERRSIGHGDKRRSLDDGALQKPHPDESDMYDKKHDPNATAELGPNAHAAALQDGQYKSSPSDVKANYMQLLSEKPTINSQTRWPEAQQDIKEDPRYHAVPSEEAREEWFNEYIQNLIKADYMQMLHDTPSITSQTPYQEAQQAIYMQPQYQAVPTDAQREQWYDEYMQSLKKKEFMNLLHDTPAITSNTKWNEAKKSMDQSDPRYQAVPTDAQREEYFNEYIQGLGPPPYSPGDGKKDKKAKEEEKRRKKEEEKRLKEEEKKRKEEEKERKRLEKEKKKHKGKPADGEQGEQEELEKDSGCSGGLFGMFGKKSQTDKQEKEEKEERVTPAATPEPEVKEEVIQAVENVAEVEAAPVDKTETEEEVEEEEFVEQKPKPIMTWALPGMKEMMEKKAQSDQAKEEETDITVPRIEIDEAPPVSDTDSEQAETQETEAEKQPEVEQVVEPVAVELVEQSYTQVTSSEPVEDNTEIVNEEEAIQTEAAVIVKDVIEKAIEVVEAESAPPVDEEKKDIVLTDHQLKEDFTQLLRETPDVTSQSCLSDVKHKIEHDPRYKNVGSDDKREKWFNEYTDNLLKADFMRLLMRTPTIHSQSTWREARQEIDLEPCFVAVNSEAKREEWFDEYIQNLLKQEYMQLLADTPSIHSQCRWEAVKDHIEADPRYAAVSNDAKREAWFDEHIQNLKKDEFMQLLRETPDITSYSHYKDARADICNDPRFKNVDSEAQREEYFNEYVENLKKEGFVKLLEDTEDITANTPWYDAKLKIDTDPRYHAVSSDLKRAKWYNEHMNRLAGIDYTSGEYGLRVGDYKSIDRKQEYMPIAPPNVTTRKTHEETMPFFEPVNDAEADAKKRVPPPIAKKPRVHSGYDSEEDRLLQNSTGVPVTVETETFKYSPDTDDMPKATSNIPIVETKTQKVTYEKDGVPYETEDSILISAHSVTTKSQTIDTTTYKTERDGVVETRVERKITVMSDGEEMDHDYLLRQAIEQVTCMNQSFEVEKIEYMRQIEDK